MLEGVARARQDNQGVEVLSLTRSIEDFELLLASAKANGKTKITINVVAEGFKAGENSQSAGQEFHRYKFSMWTPKEKKA